MFAPRTIIHLLYIYNSVNPRLDVRQISIRFPEWICSAFIAVVSSIEQQFNPQVYPDYPLNFHWRENPQPPFNSCSFFHQAMPNHAMNVHSVFDSRLTIHGLCLPKSPFSINPWCIHGSFPSKQPLHWDSPNATNYPQYCHPFLRVVL